MTAATLLGGAIVAAAAAAPPTVPPPIPPDAAGPGAESESEETRAAEGGDRGRQLPRLDVYFPEGKLDLRLDRLIKSAYFEGQIKYNFIDGDISAFLRYRYYSYRAIYQITLFDALEFEGLETFDNNFERVRGGLFLTEWPHDYHHRTFLLVEVDRLTTSKEDLRFSNNLTNTFLRLGFQRGSPDDPRLNAIVGETRARTEDLFTAHRELGPANSGLGVALTYAFDLIDADFNYLKLEAEALKRFDLTPRAFAVARIHLGAFPGIERIPDAADLSEEDRIEVPRNELFRLDGRENLKGVSGRPRGSEEIHTTVELFLPWFLGRQHQALGVTWENFYWVLYGGFGNVGFDSDVFTDVASYVSDVGFGLEASFRLKGYRFFLAAVAAQALESGSEIETHLTLRSYR